MGLLKFLQKGSVLNPYNVNNMEYFIVVTYHKDRSGLSKKGTYRKDLSVSDIFYNRKNAEKWLGKRKKEMKIYTIYSEEKLIKKKYYYIVVGHNGDEAIVIPNIIHDLNEANKKAEETPNSMVYHREVKY